MKINDVTIKTPSEITVTRADIDGESYRNAKGYLIRDRITTKTKIQCTWNGLTVSEMSTLLQAVDDKFFNITYFDPYLGADKTIEAYVGDRTAPVYSYVNGLITYKSLSFDIIER